MKERIRNFILWCLREREAVIEIDIDYLAILWHIRIDRQDISPAFDLLIREGLAVRKRIRIREGEGSYQALVLTRNGEKAVRLLPRHPHDIVLR